MQKMRDRHITYLLYKCDRAGLKKIIPRSKIKSGRYISLIYLKRRLGIWREGFDGRKIGPFFFEAKF